MTDTLNPPTLPSIDNKVQELYPKIFALSNKGDPICEIFANGRVVIHKGTNDEAAQNFWKAVSGLILTEGKEFQLLRDLTFLVTFIQSKGVFFSNPSEKVELSAWIGQIERRYGIRS